MALFGSIHNTRVHLPRFWKARNVKKSGETINVDMVLLDEKNIHASRLNTFRRHLSEVSIHFKDGTFAEKTDSEKDIPPVFNHEQLLALANTNRQLPDIVGEVVAIKNNHVTHGAQRVIVTLRIERVQLAVSDASGTPVFVSFDTAMAQLTNVRAAEGSQLT
ncbi:hypothetical protein Bca4012_010830 [Brassica carinata]